MNTAIAYYRVSTDKQGVSGLGLEAQKAVVQQTLQGHLKDSTLLAEFVEVEKGKRTDRPQLQAALALCKQQNAVLVIAKLDRLARNLNFLTNMIQSGVDFVACDMPEANKLVIHIMGAVAEYESDVCRERTKAALEAARARGVKFGAARDGYWEKRSGKEASQTALDGVNRKKQQIQAQVCPLIEAYMHKGKSLRQIAALLNEQGYRTSRGKLWGPTTVRKMWLDSPILTQ